MNSTPTLPLPRLIDALETRGVTVTGAARYRELIATRSRRPARPHRVLDLTPDQLLDYAEASATRTDNQPRVDKILSDLRSVLDVEMKHAMRAEAPAYLDRLAVDYATAADAARALRAAGVDPADTADSLLRRGTPMEAVTLWQDFRSVHARTLDDIAVLVWNLIAHGILDGITPQTDPAVLLTSPYQPRAWPNPRERTATGRRMNPSDWLTIAGTLTLKNPADLDLEALTAAGTRPAAADPSETAATPT